MSTREESPTQDGEFSPARVEALRQQVDDRLDALFHEDREPPRLTCAIRHGLLSPGKRLRPVITLLAAEQCGGDPADVLDAACAVEMVHAASLIMDDLPAMDNARLRRGCVATHVVFGEGTGLLAAITLLNEAFRIIADADGPPAERRLAAVSELAAAVGPDGLAGGQERDIACPGPGSLDPSIADMELRHGQKTGALFAAAAAIGAGLAGAVPDTVDRLRRYGHALGLAYQALDDVIDCSASSAETGKDARQDAGKSTVVTLLGASGARTAAKRWIARAAALAAEAAPGRPAPLAGLAWRIGEKFDLKA